MATTPTPASAPAAVFDARQCGVTVTVITNQKGRPLSKSATLNSDGELVLKPAAQLSQGAFRVVAASNVTELAQVLSDLNPSQALVHGVPKNGAQSGSIVSKANEQSSPGALRRSLEDFGWGAGPGWLMLDADLKGLGPEFELLDLSTLVAIRAVLCGAVPELAAVPMLGLPSASAMLYRASDGELLRGLTGTRFYVPVEHAEHIPVIGKRLLGRLLLNGLGYPFISRSGRVFPRTLIDSTVWSPEHLDFMGGASCGEGVEQRRGQPIIWNPDSKAWFFLEGPSPQEESLLAENTQDILDGAREEAAAKRAAFIEARAAAGHPIAATEGDGGLIYLAPEHAIQLSDGPWITVADILANPENYHGQTCNDPMEPDYPSDDVAKIFTVGQRSGPAIHSFAHGGQNYALDRGGPIPDATDDFEALNETPAEPKALTGLDPGASDMEHLAALTGDAEAAFFSDLPSSHTGALARWEEAQEAAQRFHPLTKVFADLVLPAALTASTRTPRTFRFTFKQALARNQVWRALPSAEQERLTQAARVLLTKNSAAGRMRLLKEVPPTEWLVKNLLLTGSMSAIVGPTNVGKSWVALYLACLVATEEGSSLTFDGRTVEKHGTVWYLTSEDAYGMIRRKEAWEKANNTVPRLHVFSGMPLLTAPHEETVRLLRTAADQTASSPVLIVFDVFTDAVEGDDNAAEVIAPAMQRARAIGEMFGATVLIVHHANKADPKDPRGSSAFKNAVDVLCAVSLDAAGIRLTWEKARSTPKGADFHFHIRNSVLQNGASVQIGESGASSEARLLARVAARELLKIEKPATRTDWNAAIVVAAPSCFDEIKSDYRRKKLSRARDLALENKWVEKDRNDRYVVGPVPVPEDTMEPGSLEDASPVEAPI